MKDGMGTEKENELSYLCGMIQSGKIPHKDAIHYLDLMKEEYELEEKQFDGLYAEWIRNGDIGRELNRIGKQEKDPDSRKPYDYVLDGLYEMVESGEIDLEMVTENLREDPYEVRKDPVKGYGVLSGISRMHRIRRKSGNAAYEYEESSQKLDLCSVCTVD